MVKGLDCLASAVRCEMRPLPRALWILLGLFGSLLLGTTSAHAVEYRLLVASIFDTTLMSFVSLQSSCTAPRDRASSESRRGSTLGKSAGGGCRRGVRS